MRVHISLNSHSSHTQMRPYEKQTETDDGRKERKSPWPPAMSDEVWTARVKLRAAMKEDMPQYKEVLIRQYLATPCDIYIYKIQVQYLDPIINGNPRQECFLVY